MKKFLRMAIVLIPTIVVVALLSHNAYIVKTNDKTTYPTSVQCFQTVVEDPQCDGPRAVVFNPKTKSVSDISLSGRSVNKTIRNFYYSGNLGSIRYGRKTYTYSGRNLYVTEKGKRKKVTRMGGTIKFLQPFKKYIFVVTEKEVDMGSWRQNKYSAIVMTVKGKKKKVITSGYNVSGGW